LYLSFFLSFFVLCFFVSCFSSDTSVLTFWLVTFKNWMDLVLQSQWNSTQSNSSAKIFDSVTKWDSCESARALLVGR
jgi:hypothetical protein